jgi:2'-5' RNA ligase
MRVFVGTIVPESLRNEIEKIQNEIKKYVFGKFVEKENLHICYSFLGEVNENEIEKIKKKLEILSYENTFKVFSNSIKLIPSLSFVRVIALEVKSNDGEKIRKWIEENVGGDSKPLHITLCRVKSLQNKKSFIDYLKNKKFYFEFEVDEISLIKSTLTYSGPIYEKIFNVKLTKI